MDSEDASQLQEYLLATGDAAETRLRLLDQIFGPATRELLTKVGLSKGWRVAEVGCGSGLVALWMAERVGPAGSITAVDSSGAQLQVARNNVESAGLKNVSFHEASADDTRLPRDSFDLVYCRFLLCHLKDPLSALKEMRRLLRSGGFLVCEDYDDTSITTDPPSPAYARLVEISRTVNAKRGLDSGIGLRLHRLFREAGFATPEVTLKQTALLRGEGKRFWELTLREAAPAIGEAGAASAEELESLCDELGVIACDETTLVVLARVSQVWSRKY